VPGAGFEPARPFGQRILSPPRLPFRHPGRDEATWAATGEPTGGSHPGPSYARPVRIDGVELLWLDLHLRRPHRSATGTERDRPVVMVRVVTPEAEGFGECAALATPDYSEEYAAGAWAVLETFLVPRLLTVLGGGAGGGRELGGGEVGGGDAFRQGGGEPPRGGEASWRSVANTVGAALAGTVGHPMAKACLEMAVVDAWLRGGEGSFAAALGVSVHDVEAGAVVGLAGRVEDLVAEVDALVGRGYRRVKVKIAPGWDVAPLRELRRCFPRLGLQADANGAYDPDDTDHLVALDDLDLLCLEQPFAAERIIDLGRLAERLDTPVCLDESATSLAAVASARALGAGDMVCVKPGRLGGFEAAVRLHDWARHVGVPLWCGGMLETGFARAANGALAGLPGFTMAGDLAGGERFVEPDPSPAPGPIDGRIPVYRGPGVGPAPDPDRLAAVTVRSRWASSGGVARRRS
jgi:o-succinylbenzoate synthase